MITIAGGILLAVAILACLPIIITGLAWLISVVTEWRQWIAWAVVLLVVALVAR